MPEEELNSALDKSYTAAISGALTSRPIGDDEVETFIPEELEKQTQGAFVVLLRDVTQEGGEKGKMEVLLVKRKDYDGLWNLPGGGVDESETFGAAAVREVEEETGLRIKIVEGTSMNHHAGALDEESEFAGERRYDRYTGAIGVIVGGELKLNEEAAAIKWFPVKELPERMYLKHKLLVQEYFSPDYFHRLTNAIFFAAQNHAFIPEGISE